MREHLATPHIIVRQNYVDIICIYTIHTITYIMCVRRRENEKLKRAFSLMRKWAREKGNFYSIPNCTDPLSIFFELAHSLPRSLARTFTQLVRSFVCSFKTHIHSLTRSFICLFVYLFRSFVHSFACSLAHKMVCYKFFFH